MRKMTKAVKRFGDKLRALRLERDITIQYMHIVTGFARSTIRRWEQNKSYPSSYQVILIIAEFFQVSPEYFCDSEVPIDPILKDILNRVQNLEREMHAIRATSKEEFQCQSTLVSAKA